MINLFYLTCVTCVAVISVVVYNNLKYRYFQTKPTLIASLAPRVPMDSGWRKFVWQHTKAFAINRGQALDLDVVSTCKYHDVVLLAGMEIKPNSNVEFKNSSQITIADSRPDVDLSFSPEVQLDKHTVCSFDASNILASGQGEVMYPQPDLELEGAILTAKLAAKFAELGLTEVSDEVD